MKGLFQEFMSWKTQQPKFKGILSQSKNIYQPLHFLTIKNKVRFYRLHFSFCEIYL